MSHRTTTDRSRFESVDRRVRLSSITERSPSLSPFVIFGGSKRKREERGERYKKRGDREAEKREKKK